MKTARTKDRVYSINIYLDIDCKEVSQQSLPLPGVYRIQVDELTFVNVNCLEGGWTVFQSRGQFGNPVDYFDKGWSEYKAGFGTPGKYEKIPIVTFIWKIRVLLRVGA